MKNIAKGTFQTIHPVEILLTRSEAVWVLLETNSLNDLEEILKNRDIQFEIVNDKLNLKIWNLMSYFVNTMIEKGVPSNTISLVLMLPVIVTVVAFYETGGWSHNIGCLYSFNFGTFIYCSRFEFRSFDFVCNFTFWNDYTMGFEKLQVALHSKNGNLAFHCEFDDFIFTFYWFVF